MVQNKHLLILTLAIVILLAVVIWFYPCSEDFRSENPFWNGLKTFTTRFDASLISSLDNLPPNPEETTLVVIPQLKLTEPEMESIQNYLSLGGTLVILDDFGYGNDVLRYMKLDTRFTKEPLVDPVLNYYRNKWFPQITNFSSTYITHNIESIVLNHATTLKNIPEDDDVIAWSSRLSFSDSNDNAIWDDGEKKGPLPVAAALEIGKGYLILIADPSILINSMEEVSDNHSFMDNILKIQDPNPEILVDLHTPEVSLDRAKSTLTTIRSSLSSPLAISGVVIVSLILTLSPIWRRENSDKKNG